MRLWLSLLCLSALVAAGSAESGESCNRTIPHCGTCRYQMYRGTVTRAICTACEPGYVVKASGRSCWCAPGFYLDGADFTCRVCAVGYWCPGSKSTSAASRTTCGTNLVTATAYAKSAAECVVNPGYGYAGPGNTALACIKGYYNPGLNTRACTRCPAGLTTVGTGSSKVTDCVAPKGYYYLRGKAVACAVGTYKNTEANVDCTECPEGFTTPYVASTAPSDCSQVLPGYAAAAGQQANLGTIGATATRCVNDTYRANTVAYHNANGVSCTLCSTIMTGLETLPGVTGATSAYQCLVPPGRGWPSSGTELDHCSGGKYNVGYNRLACMPCDTAGTGVDLIQSNTDSRSSDECYVAPGHGAQKTPTGYTGFICPADTYGRNQSVYGLQEVPCIKCPDNLFTYDASDLVDGLPKLTGRQSVAACLTQPGWGYLDGDSYKCGYGAYNPGFNQAPCTECAEGYTTSGEEATAATDCLLKEGYYTDSGTSAVLQCGRGTYKNGLGPATSCTSCPAGTTTIQELANTASTDCNTCMPGWGVAANSTLNQGANPSVTRCDRCPVNTFSVGGTLVGGLACSSCANALLQADGSTPIDSSYDGIAVSRQGTTSPDGCVRQFVTGSTDHNHAPWDYIKFGAGLTDVYNDLSPKHHSECQLKCRDDPLCVYFEWHSTADFAAENHCYIYTVASTIRPNLTAIADTVNDVAMFEVQEGVWAAYQFADGHTAGLGVNLGLAGAFEATRIACSTAPTCIGIKKVGGSANDWRMFEGSRDVGVDAKVKVYGANINAWIPYNDDPAKF